MSKQALNAFVSAYDHIQYIYDSLHSHITDAYTRQAFINLLQCLEDEGKSIEMELEIDLGAR